MTSEVRILVYPFDGVAQEQIVSTDRRGVESLVGGPFEVRLFAAPFARIAESRHIVVVINATGKLDRLPLNRFVPIAGAEDVVIEQVAGTFFFVRAQPSLLLESLEDEDVRLIREIMAKVNFEDERDALGEDEFDSVWEAFEERAWEDESGRGGLERVAVMKTLRAYAQQTGKARGPFGRRI